MKRDICLWSDHHSETEILRRTKRENTKHLYCPGDERIKSGREQCSRTCVKSCSCASCSVVSDSLQHHGL